MVTSSSEPNGTFRSENLVSNEHTFQYVIPALERRVRPGGVYMGVAPDQNFTYIAAIKPRMAFIVDIAARYAEADVVLCRGGAITVSVTMSLVA